MTAKLSIAIAVVLLSACAPDHSPVKPGTPLFAPQPPGKVIAAKVDRIEARMHFNLLARDTLASKSQTIYYLVAEDGSACEVGLSEYVRAKVGERRECAYLWHQVD